MAKLSSHGFEWLRVRNKVTGAERSYRSDGVVLAKPRGGRWVGRGTVKAGLSPAEIVRRWSEAQHSVVVSHALGRPGSDAPILTEAMVARRAKARQRSRERAAARRAARGQTLAERRAALEAEADPGSVLRRVVAWNVLRAEVGRAITCPACDGILDAARAVHAEYSTGGAVTYCASCWDGTPRQAPAGVEVTTYDGRELGDAATRQAAGMLS